MGGQAANNPDHWVQRETDALALALHATCDLKPSNCSLETGSLWGGAIIAGYSLSPSVPVTVLLRDGDILALDAFQPPRSGANNKSELVAPSVNWQKRQGDSGSGAIGKHAQEFRDAHFGAVVRPGASNENEIHAGS